MVILIITFCITAPLIILYTAGYRYDLGNKQFLTTGVLSIDVQTPDVDIQVNDIAIADRPPTRLPNLTPGLYTVEISRTGFHPWHNTVQVHSNQTTYIQDVVLIKDRIPVGLLYTSSSTIPISVSEQGEFLYYTKQQGTSTRHSLLNLATTQTDTFWTLPTSATTNALWSPFTPLLLFTYGTDTTSQLAVINPTTPTTFAKYRNVRLDTRQWYISGENHLYGQVERWIERFTPTEQQLVEKTSSSLWFVDDSATVWEYTTSTQLLHTEENEIFLPFPISSVLDVTPTFVLAEQSGGYVQIFTRSGNTITETEQIVADRVFFDTDTNIWYAWSDWEVWRIYGNSGKTELLHRSSKPIQFVYPLDTRDMVLFVSDNSLLAFDATYYSHNVLLQAQHIQDIAVNKWARKIYMIATINEVSGVFELDY